MGFSSDHNTNGDSQLYIFQIPAVTPISSYLTFMAGWKIEWFEKGDFDSCINISDGFDTTLFVMKTPWNIHSL